MRLLFVDCYSGLSGDMWLGALADLGASTEEANHALASIGTGELTIEVSAVTIGGISASRAAVRAGTEERHRSWLEIRRVLERADLSDHARDLTLAAFKRLAEAEASVHGCAVEEVQFHEVGAWDSIADIVGACVMFDSLDIDRCVCSPLPIACGFTGSEHGRLPLPAPATLQMLRGVPTTGVVSDLELTTPTGAALALTFADRFSALWPDMMIEALGYGAGSYQTPWPNALRLITGETDKDEDPLFCIEANIDDMDTRIFPHIIESLLSAGALDAWLVPVIMKKGRPGYTLKTLCEQRHLDRIAEMVLRDTTSIGVRHFACSRRHLKRTTTNLKTRFGDVRFKLIEAESSRTRLAPEFEDVVRVASASGLTILEVLRSLEAIGIDHLRGLHQNNSNSDEL